MMIMSTMRSKPKSSSPLHSYSLNVLMFVMVAIAFTNWKGCKNYRCLYAQYLGTFRDTLCPGSRPAMAKPPPTGSVMGNYSSAAVSVDGEPCAQVGIDVFRRNGTVVDAAIATLFCNGIVNSHSMGIGGGFLMTLYLREQNKVITLNARETAPAASGPNMYAGNAELSKRGVKSAGVPGEVRGYWEAKKLYGNKDVSWESLIEPSIRMCYNGIRVTWHAAAKLEKLKGLILEDPGAREVFINPRTGDVWQEGDIYKRRSFGRTLQKIAQNGVDEFYVGETAKKLIGDVTKAGGIITLQDLKSYEKVAKVLFGESVSTVLGRYTLHSFPPPGSGAVLIYILNIMKHYNISPGDDVPVLYHRMAEAFKWAYAERTKLGDPTDPEISEEIDQIVSRLLGDEMAEAAHKNIMDTHTIEDASFYGSNYLVTEDHGTAHTSLLAPNGDAVAVTSTINWLFGSVFLSPSTGIILNDNMGDFAYENIISLYEVEPSKANFAKPGKRPLSSMSPTIVIDEDGDVVLVVGASGGTRITTSVAQVIMRNLWLGEDIKSAIDARRIHHQLLPMQVSFEDGVTSDVTDYLTSCGHQLNDTVFLASNVVQGISRKDGRVYANYDFRKAGGVAGF